MGTGRTVDLVVFDLDGTLIDSRRDLADSVNALLAELGRAPLPEAVVAAMVGEGARLLVNRALEARGLVADRPGALERFLELYDGRLLVHTRAYDGVPEMLDALDGRLTMAVLTNKPRGATGTILEALGLARHFVEMLGGNGPFPRKPDPAALHHLIDLAHATADTTMMVGDSPIDLQTAQAAGTHVVLARYGFGFRFSPEELSGAAVIDRPQDLLTLIAPRTPNGTQHSAPSTQHSPST